MSLLDEIRSGARGASLTLPATFQVLEQSASHALVGDRAAGFAWMLLCAEHRLSLDPADDALLRHDVERHARGMFSAPPGVTPRTSDPAWSPVIDFARVGVRGGESLLVVHRLAYAPGVERVMGHLLVPTAEGTLEIRCIPASRGPTGVRESALMDRALAESRRGLTQAEIDDPRHDATFPNHPLSITRRALHWLTSESDLLVTRPAQPAARDVPLDDPRYVVTMPPRFVARPGRASNTPMQAQASRVSLSASPDGVQLLSILRFAAGAAPLAETARTLAERLTNVRQGARVTLEPVGSSHARTVAEFVDPSGMSVQQVAAFAQSGSETWVCVIAAPGALDARELQADAEAALGSVRWA